jgi:DNA segregation ATPase FtsK/SpoIIIE, S-DNA-T family
VARVRASVERAAALHRQAVAMVDTAQQALDQLPPDAAPVQQHAAQRQLAEVLRNAAAELAPGWSGAPLDAFPALSPLPRPGMAEELPRFVRVGVGYALEDARFPVVVPLLGVGHLAVNGDARDPRVAGLITSLVLRLVAASPAGELKIRAVDSTGSVFGPFAPLVPARVMAEPATDRNGFRDVLSEAEQWVRNPGRYTMLVVIAALPELTEGPELARLAMLAQSGPAARLHLVVAGWPPPPLTAETTQPPLALTTQITLRNPHALVGDPPGGAFGSQAALGCPVYLDGAPAADVVRRVCASVVEQVQRVTPTLSDLLPAETWQQSSADGLAVDVGEAGGSPVSLRLADLTPHWLVGGRSGAGKTAFLINTLYGLAARYGPDELTLYLLDFKEGVSFTEFTPTERDPSWIPQARAVGIESDREYGLAVLRELDAEMTRRGDAFKRAGVSRFVDLRAQATDGPLSRMVCVIDEFQVLLQGNDRLARDAVALLESLARKGRSYGIHLILASQTTRGVESLYAKRDSIFGQFALRVALPGGGDVLDPVNQAADGLGLGQAVVNTAGGLGGPTGAARAHERVISFPDPHADPATLTALRHRLWQARPAGARPPYVFAGFADQYLPDVVPATTPPTAYLGRLIDVPLSLAGYQLDARPGRHLAVLAPGDGGAAILAAATRSLATQRQPGTVHFAIAAPVDSPLVGRTVKELRAAGHTVSDVDGAGLAALAGNAELTDTYLIGFGLDAANGVDLRPVLRPGPGRNVHVLGWWRGQRRFAEDTGGGAAREDMAGLVLLDLPATDVVLLTGEAGLDWQPRPNRALRFDRHTGQADVFVPFTDPGRV